MEWHVSTHERYLVISGLRANSCFAVWLTKQRATIGPVFGSVDRFEGLGVFFDTYDNERARVRKILLPVLVKIKS